VFLGPDITPAEIEQTLRTADLLEPPCPDIDERIAELLAEGYVVARCAGRMEYGPRALGNRSILYRPDDPSVNDWLNERLRRTEFMPFAPITRVETIEDAYHNAASVTHPARFMTITRHCTARMRRMCGGVVHVDGTARPQYVDPQATPELHRILTSFTRRTGLGSLINTSFNIHEEPIVCTAQDAVRAFLDGHLDYLALGDRLIRNPQLRRKPAELEHAAQGD
jgi:carbamoyltransferase